MQIEKYQSELLGLIYNGYSIILTSEELTFEYIEYENNPRFCFDINPLGETNLKEIHNFNLNESLTRVSFQVIDDGSNSYLYQHPSTPYDKDFKEKHYIEEQSIYPQNKIAYKIIDNVNNNSQIIPTDNYNFGSIRIVFEKGKLILLDIKTHKNKTLDLDWVWITRENDKLVLKAQGKPVIDDIKIDYLSVADGCIKYNYQNKSVSLPLDISNSVYKLIENLLKTIL